VSPIGDELAARYRAFVDRSPTSDDGYLFDSPRCRFWPEPSDELVAPPGARVVAASAGPAIELPGGAALVFRDLTLEELRSALAALPCRHGMLSMRLGPKLAPFVEQAFSRVLFAPAAVAELEQQVPSLEIVRFPGSPYEVVRAYWRNMAAVRARIAGLEVSPQPAELVTLVRELHVTLLTGTPSPGERSSFYLPASQLGRKRATPGELYETVGSFERRAGSVVLTGGARVSVPLLGGAHYWQLLAEGVSDESALARERALRLEGSEGLELGQVLEARGENEAVARPWFLPPRPLKPRHFALLAAHLETAHRALAERDRAALLRALAAFHYHFVRFHPLPSGNQSLAMAFVNEALSRALGAGIPHLLLDQMALRFELVAYERLFARAVTAWSAPWPSPAERLRHQLRMRDELNQFVSELARAESLLEARALLPERPHGSRLALLSDD
jgi:hypothetical protein